MPFSESTHDQDDGYDSVEWARVDYFPMGANVGRLPRVGHCRAGDRIRVEISSSDYPQFAPNPNTREPFGQSAATVVATQTILHDAAHPSSITLPVIP